MPVNVTIVPGATQADIYLGNYAYADIVAHMEELRWKLDTAGSNCIFYKNAAGALSKVMRDASDGTNHPAGRVLYTDADGKADTDAGLLWDGSELDAYNAAGAAINVGVDAISRARLSWDVVGPSMLLEATWGEVLYADAADIKINPTQADVDTTIYSNLGAALFVHGADGRVMVGSNAAPDALLHVRAANTGVAKLPGSVAIFENTTDFWISLLCGGMATEKAGFYFCDAAGYGGRLYFDAANDPYAGWHCTWATIKLWSALSTDGGGNFEFVVNEQGLGAVDFRVEGDTDTHLLFVDASADKACISTDTPLAAKLTIVQDDASGESCASLKQDDESEGFIDFVGSARGAISESTNSTESVRVELNGTVYRLALYADA